MFILGSLKCLTQSSSGVMTIISCRNVSKLSRREYLYGISPCFAAIKARQRNLQNILKQEI